MANTFKQPNKTDPAVILETYDNEDDNGAVAVIQRPDGTRVLSLGDMPQILLPTTPVKERPVESSVVTAFQSGHGFAASPGSSGSQADDTVDFLFGDRAYKLTTAGTNGFTACRRTGMGAVDLTGKMLVMQIKVDRPDRLVDCRLDVSSDVFTNWTSFDTISPSTNILSPFYTPDEWTYVTMYWGAGAVGGGAGATRNAVTAFQVRCKDDGTGPINMRVQKVAVVPEPASALLSIVFDDGYDGTILRAKPILDAAVAGGLRACFAPIVNKITTPAQTNFMTLDQLYRLRDSGWEAMPHAYDVNVHSNYATMTDNAVIADMVSARRWLIDNGFGNANNIVVPQGQTTSLARMNAWKKLSTSARTAYTRVRETYPPGKLHALRTYTLSVANAPADIQAKIDECLANKGWLILQAHNVVTSTSDPTDYSTANFQTVVNYIVSTFIAGGGKVKTVDEVLRTGTA